MVRAGESLTVVCHHGYTSKKGNSYQATCKDNGVFDIQGDCVEGIVEKSEKVEEEESTVGGTVRTLLLMLAVLVGLVVIVLGARVRTE